MPRSLTRTIGSISHFLHEQFIYLLIACYVLAGFFPSLGLWIRHASFGCVNFCGMKADFSLPAVMLSFLLFNAGLGIRSVEFKELREKPLTMLSALLCNLMVPIAFILILSCVKGLWHNPDEMQNILVGLALISSMPIAGSSTAWSQNSNGNLVLSVGLVLFSTLISPIVTPLALHAGGWLTTGDYSEDLHELAQTGAMSFLALCVVLPIAVGLLSRKIIGESVLVSVNPCLKILNSVNLLLLVYSNAAISLPQAFRTPDWDFLFLILVIATTLCAVMFGSGWLLAKNLRLAKRDTTSVLFALGMNNNGTGLVLASMAMSDHPAILLPIIFYNLIQHLIAGIVDRMNARFEPSS